MNSTRRDLIAMATFMPEPALETAYVLLKTIKDTHDAMVLMRNSEQVARPPVSAPNVVEFRRRPARREFGNPHHASASPEDVARLKRRIAESEQRVARIKRHIGRAEAHGWSTTAVEELLATFLRSLDLMRDHLDFMLRPVRKTALN